MKKNSEHHWYYINIHNFKYSNICGHKKPEEDQISIRINEYEDSMGR